MPVKKDNLWKNIQKTWYDINKHDLEALYESMPHRIEAVIKSKDDVTKY